MAPLRTADDHSMFTPKFGRAFAALLSGLLLFAAFHPLAWSLAAWFALVPLVLLGVALPPRAAFAWGWAAGCCFWLPSIAWLTRVSVIGWALLSFYCALWIGLFAMLVAFWLLPAVCSRGGFCLRALLGIPALWVGCEYLRATLFSGFPWNLLGASQYRQALLIQCAGVGGVALVSFLVALVNAACALCLMVLLRVVSPPRRSLYGALALAAGALAVCLLYGNKALTRAEAEAEDGLALRVAAVQLNVPQALKWSPAQIEEIYRRLLDASARAAHTEPELIVWPETAVPDFVLASRGSLAAVRATVQLGAPLLMGSMDVSGTEDDPRYFNSAFLFQSPGAAPLAYAKRHLVIFGEYIPFERQLPLLRALAPMEESFTPGSEGMLFRLGARTCAVLICFEDLVAGLARADVRLGARLLINLTNDAWFDPSWASWQHAALAVFRCVENGVPLVRSTNTGLTCLVDRCGRIRAALPVGRGQASPPDCLTGSVMVPPAGMPLTFYTRHGDLPAIGCAAFTLTLLAAALIGRLFARMRGIRPRA